MLQFYLDLIAYLQSLDSFFQANTYSKIMYMDRFRGQYLMPAEHGVFDCPAVFFEMSADWMEAGDLTQNGTLNIRAHVVQRNLADSSSISLDRSTAMQVFEFTEVLHDCLQGYNTTHVGNLLRRRTVPDIGYNGEMVDIMEYTATIVDDSSDRFKKYVLNSGDASISIAGRKLAKTIPNAPATSRQYILPG